MRSGIFIPVSPIPGTEEAPINIEYVDGKKNTRGIATWHLVNIISKAAFVLQIFFSPYKAAETWKPVLSQCKMPLENSAFLLDESLELGEFL